MRVLKLSFICFCFIVQGTEALLWLFHCLIIQGALVRSFLDYSTNIRSFISVSELQTGNETDHEEAEFRCKTHFETGSDVSFRASLSCHPRLVRMKGTGKERPLQLLGMTLTCMLGEIAIVLWGLVKCLQLSSAILSVKSIPDAVCLENTAFVFPVIIKTAYV